MTTLRPLLFAAGLWLAFGFAWPASARAETPPTLPDVQPAQPAPLESAPNTGFIPASGATPAEQAQMQKRAWGPEQAIGAPDTNEAGDIQTAWASLTQDDQREWLICHYTEETLPVAVLIHETFNPGAVYQVSFLDAEGKETVAWTGNDPTPPTEAKGLSVIPVKTDVAIKKIKIYIDSPKVPGWNEIDAVGLRTADGEMLWASNVEASSTYASGIEPPQPTIIVTQQQLLQIQQLENKVNELQKEVDRLKELEKRLDELTKRLDQEQKQ